VSPGAELAASWAEPDALRAEWEALAERVGASPFLHPGWVEAWWRAFGRGALALCVVRHAPSGRLAALVPVRRARGALASPTNWHTPEFGWLAESADSARALCAALFAGRARRVALGFLAPAQAALLAEAAERARYRVLRRTLQRSPWVALEGDWASYERGRGKNLRGDLGRRARRLADRGAVTFEEHAGAESAAELERLLARGFALEAAGWKGERGSAIASQPATARFYAELARWAAARGWLRLCFLCLDGRALAFDYCLQHAGVHWMLKTGFDPACAELSPGKLLRRERLARAFAEGLRAYELLGAEEPWKLAWATGTRERELVQAFAPSVLGRLDHSLFAYGRPLARRVRERLRRRAEPAGAPREA